MCSFPHLDIKDLAEFLSKIASQSQKPNSILLTAIAAVGHIHVHTKCRV